ncbi:3-hydroxyacyl-[acyl-carrier-protein] dehydratase FabZ [Guyparkeria sp. SCN-R1]|uniref:3-hydroxyacyl-ACP dehydratase FabZ n=1 Tax=unclassified Guyparkeria TaxID=2626246 RepID=UPI000F646705|nr:3-hydroxyacyl-ACP dehydratase FabZ [Guyparkeria sp. SCN-R1]RRQ24857.1 3-hydroxyacyl-[acyl-carrier-protein] dehydratase FabZ [Guyparkeria sp. SCN-R1]
MMVQEIMNLLPHRYPFLLIDRVVDWKPNEYLVAIKNVTFNEPFFQGHFPVRPIMPGVLITEAMAQATGVLAFRSNGGKPKDNALYMLVGLDDVTFRRMVEPGDQLTIRVEIKRMARGMGIFNCTAHVGDELASRATVKCVAKEVIE